ncbi:MAG: hypothetical protein VKS61_08375 [Candidatus Sericytochromatia bacterium]|nr:hypothetical protein [Candidatus Sericytochromatia bacterium]
MARQAIYQVTAALALFLTGCPTREFYRIPAEPDWTALGSDSLEVPVFAAPTAGWSLAQAARQRVTDDLTRATLPVTATPSRVRLLGSIEDLRVTSTASAPRRVLRAGTSTTGNIEAHVWEQEVEHRLRLRVALRLERLGSGILWQRSAEGEAVDSRVETLGWPGSDPLPPPPSRVAPALPAMTEALGRQALQQALAPLLGALTDSYGYRVVP